MAFDFDRFRVTFASLSHHVRIDLTVAGVVLDLSKMDLYIVRLVLSGFSVHEPMS
jgi:hypothetical protein